MGVSVKRGHGNQRKYASKSTGSGPVSIRANRSRDNLPKGGFESHLICRNAPFVPVPI